MCGFELAALGHRATARVDELGAPALGRKGRTLAGGGPFTACSIGRYPSLSSGKSGVRQRQLKVEPGTPAGLWSMESSPPKSASGAARHRRLDVTYSCSSPFRPVSPGLDATRAAPGRTPCPAAVHDANERLHVPG